MEQLTPTINTTHTLLTTFPTTLRHSPRQVPPKRNPRTPNSSSVPLISTQTNPPPPTQLALYHPPLQIQHTDPHDTPAQHSHRTRNAMNYTTPSGPHMFMEGFYRHTNIDLIRPLCDILQQHLQLQFAPSTIPTLSEMVRLETFPYHAPSNHAGALLTLANPGHTTSA